MYYEDQHKTTSEIISDSDMNLASQILEIQQALEADALYKRWINFTWGAFVFLTLLKVN